MKLKIPAIRAELRELSTELKAPRLAELAEMLHRDKHKVGRAPGKPEPLDYPNRVNMYQYMVANPEERYSDVAPRFGVNTRALSNIMKEFSHGH